MLVGEVVQRLGVPRSVVRKDVVRFSRQGQTASAKVHRGLVSNVISRCGRNISHVPRARELRAQAQTMAPPKYSHAKKKKHISFAATDPC